jgi:CDP-paratose synthetase
MEGTILITGATGFIGSHVARALVAEGRDVTILCRSFSQTNRISDILDRVRRINLDHISLNKALEGCKVAGVVHLATNYDQDESQTEEIFKTNFLLPLQLLDFAVSRQAKFFINTDSFFCKPQFAYPHMLGYTYSKQCFLGWAKNSVAKIHISTLQLEHVYGPADGPKKFVSTVLRQLMDPSLTEIKLTEGRQKRDFVFISDVVDAYLRVIDNAENAKPGFMVYETGTGESIEIRHFVELLRNATSSKANLVFGAIPYRAGEIMNSRANLTALNALGYYPITSLEVGIKKLVKAAQ